MWECEEFATEWTVPP